MKTAIRWTIIMSLTFAFMVLGATLMEIPLCQELLASVGVLTLTILLLWGLIWGILDD